MNKRKKILKNLFGYDFFRTGQESIISSILTGRDGLGIMPTGAGKSICYQVPALMLPGITLVISPLISLMQDQVKALNEVGIHAAFINSSLTETQIRKALHLAADGAYKIIYMAPERLESHDFMEFANQADGIIYCATRKNVDNLFEILSKRGIPVTKYHAGMDNVSRKKNQDNFIYDRTSVIVATNAFGMGIDKSNVRYVIHYNMPQSMENYYQEAGRAGRDGESAQCILLFSAQDIIINKFLLENKDFSGLDSEEIKLIRQRDMRRLQVMVEYCRTTLCLRNYILNYFGEKAALPCDKCSNCH